MAKIGQKPLGLSYRKKSTKLQVNPAAPAAVPITDQVEKSRERYEEVKGRQTHNVITVRMLFPACIKSKASLILSSGSSWVIIGSILISPRK